MLDSQLLERMRRALPEQERSVDINGLILIFRGDAPIAVQHFCKCFEVGDQVVLTRRAPRWLKRVPGRITSIAIPGQDGRTSDIVYVAFEGSEDVPKAMNIHEIDHRFRAGAYLVH